jgi:hypothetical protein
MRAAPALLLLLAIAAIGCQEGDPKKREDRPAAISREDMAAVDAMAQLIGGLRRAVDSSRGDCDRMAAALAPVMERGKPVIDRARALEKKLEGDKAAQGWVQAYVERTSGGSDAIATGVAACAEHPGVRQALAGFIQ